MMHKRFSTGVFDSVPEELRKLPPLAVDIFQRIIVPIIVVVAMWLLAFLGGCAHQPKLGRAIEAGQLAMGVVRESTSVLEVAHHTATDAAIAYCRATVPANADAPAREDCLAKAGFSPAQIEQHIAALDKLGEAYDAIAAALELMAEADRVLTRMQERAKELEQR